MVGIHFIGLISKKYSISVFFLEFNIYKLARSIDAVLVNLKIMNKVFSEVNLDYKNVFAKLQKAGIDLKEDHTVPLDGASQGKCPKFYFKHWKFPFSDDINKFVVRFLKIGNCDRSFRN